MSKKSRKAHLCFCVDYGERGKTLEKFQKCYGNKPVLTTECGWNFLYNQCNRCQMVYTGEESECVLKGREREDGGGGWLHWWTELFREQPVGCSCSHLREKIICEFAFIRRLFARTCLRDFLRQNRRSFIRDLLYPQSKCEDWRERRRKGTRGEALLRNFEREVGHFHRWCQGRHLDGLGAPWGSFQIWYPPNFWIFWPPPPCPPLGLIIV